MGPLESGLLAVHVTLVMASGSAYASLRKKVVLVGLAALLTALASGTAALASSSTVELALGGDSLSLQPHSLFASRLLDKRSDVLRVGTELSLLRRYRSPERSGDPEWRAFWQGDYGVFSWWDRDLLTWSPALCEAKPVVPRDPWQRWLPSWAVVLGNDSNKFDVAPSFWTKPSAWLEADAPTLLPAVEPPPCQRWQQPKAVAIARVDGEWDRLALLDCGRGVTADALDRVSILARPPNTPRPELPLPFDPAPGELSDEWVPNVKLVHPRLLWVLQTIAEAFPRRAILIYSGYRREAANSPHQLGRALDVAVRGVPNEDLLRLCRRLNDVGCGYYPNSRFVHFDVRAYGSHHPFWIDISAPGQTSVYVNTWPTLQGH